MRSARRTPPRQRRRTARLIAFVADRPGHDARYAVDDAKLRDGLGWSPEIAFADGMEATVDWYLAHGAWCDAAAGRYDGRRLGLGADAAAG